MKGCYTSSQDPWLWARGECSQSARWEERRDARREKTRTRAVQYILRGMRVTKYVHLYRPTAGKRNGDKQNHIHTGEAEKNGGHPSKQTVRKEGMRSGGVGGKRR